MIEPRPAPRVTGARASVAGAVVSGLAAYGFTIVAARVVGDVAYAPVGVLWTVQYLVLTVGLLSLEAWITRDGVVPPAAWRWVGLLSAGLGLTTHLAAPALLGSDHPAWTVTAILIGLGFGLFAIARGVAAADGDLRSYGLMTGGESLLRLLVLLALVPSDPTGPPVALTLPAGALTVALVHLATRRRRVRTAVRVPESAGAAGAGRVTTRQETEADDVRAPVTVAPFLAATTSANAVLQLLLAGGPLLTAALGAEPAVTSSVFVTTSAARAPLVLVYSGLLARLLAAVRRTPREVVAARTRQVAALAPLVVGLSAAIGWAAGPPLVAFAFGASLRPSPLFGALTAAAVVAAILLLSGNQVLIAVRASGRLWVPWAVALVVAAVVAGLSGDLTADIRAGLVTLCGLLSAGALLILVLPRAVSR